jgi:hypothetical protein
MVMMRSWGRRVMVVMRSWGWRVAVLLWGQLAHCSSWGESRSNEEQQYCHDIDCHRAHGFMNFEAHCRTLRVKAVQGESGMRNYM